MLDDVFQSAVAVVARGDHGVDSGVAELIGRGVMAVVAAHEKSYRMACMASPFAWIVATALLFVLYFYVMKDMKKKLCL